MKPLASGSLLLALAATLTGCGGSSARPNVLLITLDTTRPDYIGTYGYENGDPCLLYTSPSPRDS